MDDNMYNFEAYGNNSIDYTNKAGGKPIYYLIKASNLSIGPESNASAVYCLNCTNISIKGLSLVNNTNGIYFINSSLCLAEDNLLSGNNNGIILLNSSSIKLVHNRIKNCRVALSVYHSNYNNIMDNDLRSSRQSNILLFNSSNNTVKGNTINDSKFLGIYIESYSNCNLIEGNTLIKNQGGIGIMDSDLNIVY